MSKPTDTAKTSPKSPLALSKESVRSLRVQSSVTAGHPPRAMATARC
jgi:hypothetical protein